MATPAKYQTNADGTVTVLGFPRKVRISAATARSAKRWYELGKAGSAWPGPTPIRCYEPACGKEGFFNTRSVRKGEELTLIYYECAYCGARDVEPFD